ncbi:MAG TPA: hypothetical protein VHO03_05450 [Ignavibacteriales bacterium]|nr:hypothetical protein [Ignavibacteriales bacterium]
MCAMNLYQTRSKLWVWVSVIIFSLVLLAVIIIFISQPVAVRRMPATSGNPSVTDTAAARGK